MTGITIFLNTVLPQLLSSVLLLYAFVLLYVRFCKSTENHYQVSNMAIAILFLIFGKITVLATGDPDTASLYVNMSLAFFFQMMAVTFTRFMWVDRRYQVWAQLAILPFAVEFILPGTRHGEFIAIAYLYLVALISLGTISRKGILMLSFVILSFLNLLYSTGRVGQGVYVWIEVGAYALFTWGMSLLYKEFLSKDMEAGDADTAIGKEKKLR